MRALAPASTHKASAIRPRPYHQPQRVSKAACMAHNTQQQQQQQQQQQRPATQASDLVSSSQQQPQGPLVRPVRDTDKPAWLRLFKDYIAWYKASVPDDIIELTWQRMLAGGEGSHQGLVAEDRSTGELVGLAHLLLHRSTWSATHYCYLEDLYVHHEVRGGGVGQALIEAVYAAADEQGATKTYWQTHECNYRARGLYDKMGSKSPFVLYVRS